MAGGVTLTVRQIGSYAAAGAANPGDLVLLQPGGLGNPYASISAATLVATGLRNGGGPLGISTQPPADANEGQIFSASMVYNNPGAGPLFNLYFNNSGGLSYLAGGIGAAEGFENNEFFWQVSPAGVAGATVPTLSNLMILNVAGGLQLPQGTLTVARDPAGSLEVATMGWVGRSTVASFNGRRGVVQLNSADIYSALCLDSAIASQNWVNSQIQASTQMLLANHPFVFGWNGRVGAVWLTLADISCVFFQPGQQPITQTPPLNSNDYSIPNTAWVVNYIQTEIGGSGTTLATQSWVLANTVNSFNGRMGPVTLTGADVFDVGAAPLNSPQFSGVPSAPTAAVGQATGQIATTAFVQMAISANTAGVSTFNTRSGAVVLEAADVTGVGGIVNPSANLTGAPTAPTAAPGTNTPQIANTEFVQAAIAAGAVTSFNTRTGAVTLTLADVTGVGGAPLVSPAFSSVPTAPTAAPGTNTVQLATTAFVTAALSAAGGVSSFNSRTGAIVLEANDVSAVGGLINPSVGLTGVPTAPTATAGTNTNQIATTAFVATALSSGAVTSFNTRTGAVTLSAADITGAGGALLASPALTGTPTAPTAAPGVNNTQIATTAYVLAAIAGGTAGVSSWNTRTGAVTLTTPDITGAGGAPIASPSFTGVPLGPTATPGTSTTQLATTAFVMAAIAASGVTSWNSRTGAVTLQANDLSAVGGALLAGPAFTGVPTAPTASPGTNTTQLATTAFVAAALSALGTGPFLPLAGGTLAGPLTVNVASGNALTIGQLSIAPGGAITSTSSGNFGPSTISGTTLGTGGNVQANGNLTVSGGQVLIGTTGTFFLQDGNPLRTFQWLTGWTNTFNVSNGTRNWNSSALGTWGMSLDGSGNLYTHGTVNGSSDQTGKTNITPITQGISLIRQLLPKSFAFNSAPEVTRWGFIAQDVEGVIPEAVSNSPPNPDGVSLLALDVTAIVAALTYALKQLDQRCTALEAAASITPSAPELA